MNHDATQLTLDVEHDAGHARKSAHAFKTISETADLLDVPQHVLRFWESKFRQIQPLKMKGGRRYYRPEDIAVLQTIKELLYRQGYTIKGARKALLQAKKSRNVSMPAHPPVEDETASVADAAPKPELGQIKQDLMNLRGMLQDALRE